MLGRRNVKLAICHPTGGQTGEGFPRPAPASIRDRAAVTADKLQGNARGHSPPQHFSV
jgi:hypothetical protein